MNRILWNRRPTDPCDGGDIDEIVVHDATVHIEQMNGRCWWIGIELASGACWYGNFSADSRGRMSFWQQEGDVKWGRDESHELEGQP